MRRIHISITILALVAAACTTTATTDTTRPAATSLVVTTTSTMPPPTLVVDPISAPDTLEVWVPDVLVRSVGSAAGAFEIDTGISVDVKAFDFENMLAVLLADPAGGPDVFIGPHTWLTELTRAGIAEPTEIRSEVVAGAAEAVTLRGFSYAAPLALDTVVQFRETNVMATAPESVEELAAGCPVGDEVVPCLLLSSDSTGGHYPFITALGGYVFGPDEFDGWNSDDIGIAGAEAISGGLILESIIDGAGILGDGQSTAVERFIDGDAPLLWGDAASLAALGIAGVVFSTESIPSIGERTAPTPIRVTAAWINAFSAHKEAAAVLVNEYLANPVNAEPMAIALGMAPVTIGFQDDPHLIPFIQAARTGHPVPTIAATELAWSELAKAFEAIRGGDDVADSLIAAAANIRAGG
ncbi:MAG: extracellular solute-binding protein [Acidimicrobiia bacterium]